MSRRIRKSSVLIGVGILSFIVLLWGVDLLAQKKRSRTPLPAYFKDVITEKQREAIYEIQQKYTGQIEKLEMQLDELKSQRDAEVFALLTDAQKKRVQELKAEAKARAEANKKVKESVKRKGAKPKE